jgi:hypothetical protein
VIAYRVEVPENTLWPLITKRTCDEEWTYETLFS